jgi:hypothetical protein
MMRNDEKECVLHQSGHFYVIKNKNAQQLIPLFCTICSFPLLSHDDFMSQREYSCCLKCNMRWVEPDKNRWLDGWRPSKEQINEELKRINKRPERVRLT